jgi:hypothetical protein
MKKSQATSSKAEGLEETYKIAAKVRRKDIIARPKFLTVDPQ